MTAPPPSTAINPSGDHLRFSIASSDTEGGLESALIDQRMRADRHKSNFEALKVQHLALQEVENHFVCGAARLSGLHL